MLLSSLFVAAESTPPCLAFAVDIQESITKSLWSSRSTSCSSSLVPCTPIMSKLYLFRSSSRHSSEHDLASFLTMRVPILRLLFHGKFFAPLTRESGPFLFKIIALDFQANIQPVAPPSRRPLPR